MDVPILEIRNLSVALPRGLDRAFAVEGVSLSVRPREIACVVGESGSGKSVTASVVMGLLPKSLSITSGSVRLEGEEISRASEARMNTLRGNRMAMIFQEPLTALNPVMRLGDQIAEVLALHKPEMSKAAGHQRVLELMEDVRLPSPETIYRRYPHQISGGQRQRVMIAMALAMEPALIIADEPTTALDVTTQAQILRLFKELLVKHDSGILMITHDFGVVADVADHVTVMQHGRVVESGVPDEVLGNPQHPYTRELIAAVPRLRYLPAAAPAEPTLEVKNLHLTYRQTGWFRKTQEVHALDGVSFALAPRETLGIVGESGSGKSTLAKAVLGFEQPNGGEILFGNHDLLSLSASALANVRHRIQMIFQDPYSSLNPRRRIGQSLVEGPVRHGKSTADARRRAIELLELVGLQASSMDRFPHEFSGGQRQRLCIARALALEPEVIVADEAVSALDVTVQAQVLDLFKSLQKELGFAMLFITHDLRVASNICNQIAVMRRGRIVEMGEAKSVFENPQHGYTRELLAALPGAELR
ncbi:ABC transporter ATP-binding protein [Rhodoligotrophos defluvii]|uniref:ABC transporter ATP-binding protein n=1 Tax=Rhodoligotrophos defluvii TaxID=2561934 RepID=UPI0019608C43|nr:ABC transporter ATP-binding protein [Rhodoligotrophos defluvii]